MKKVFVIASLVFTSSAIMAQFAPPVHKEKVQSAQEKLAKKECLEKLIKDKEGQPDRKQLEKCLEEKGVKNT